MSMSVVVSAPLHNEA
jgi:hypothetical protein